jgi:hypothetical protein
MPISFPQYRGADDLLFPMDGPDQTRFDRMQVITFSGASAPRRCAQFIREYTNRDSTQGLPPAHIGATSPYIDNGMIYLFYQDNAQAEFTEDEIGDANTRADANTNRLLAVESNSTLVSQLQGADSGWQ